METDETKKEVVNLDSILEILGPYGRYNIMNFILLIFPVILSGLFECGYMFEAQAISYRCEVNGCENTFNDTSWLKYAIPKKEVRVFESCLRYASVSNQTIQQCIPEEFHFNKTVSCDKYVYESKGFLVEDFDLGCQEWKRTLVGTVHNSGMFAALVLTGALSDRYGRKKAVGLASTACLIFGIARSFSPNYLTYLAMHFLEAGFGGGLYPSSYVLAVELVGLKQRVFVSAMCNMAFVVGEVILAVLAMFVTNWRTYVMILYIPAVIVSIYVWFMNESARWLLSKGRKDEAIKALKRAAKINNLDPKKLDLNSLTDPLLKTDGQPADRKSQLFLALHSSIIWKRVMICSFLWITCSLVYYGMSINAVSLSGSSDSNKYLNYIFVVLVEIPAYIVVVIVLDKYGRKKTMITCFVICAATSILFAVLSKGAWWSIVLYLIGKWSVTLAYSSVYIYVSEVFPTNMRQTLISVCSTSGRIGSLVAPMTPLLPMPTLIFGAMCIASSCFVLLLPETKNIRMPDTIQESENLSRVKKNRTEDLDMT